MIDGGNRPKTAELPDPQAVSIGQLIVHATQVEAVLPSGEALQRLRDAGRETAAVVDGGRLQGMLTQAHLATVMSGRYGFSLHARLPVTRHMIPEALVLPWETPVTAALERVLERPPGRFNEDLVVIRPDGKFGGVVPVAALVRSHLDLLRLKAATLETQQSTLARQNEELRGLAKQLEQSNHDLAVARDAAEKAARMKSMFLANMSHEIRTPMNSVIGFLQLLVGTALDPVQRDYATTARASAESLMDIINDILDFTRSELGNLRVECQAVKWHQLVQEIVAEHRPRAEQAGNEIVVEEADTGGTCVQADPQRLRQVMNNLLGNALKFTQHGRIRVRAERVCEPHPARIRLTISDTGIGIAPGVLPQLFTPFTQADGSTTRRFGGTGLGLAICKQLLERMNGTIGVNSIVDQGSTFWFELPAVPEPTPLPPETLSNREGQHPPLLGRVLLVEDNAVNRKLAEAVLRKLGLEVHSAEHGLAALDQLEAQACDIVLLDLQMPVLDGWSTARKIRERGLACRSGGNLPLVAFSANVLDEDRLQCVEAGMDAFVAKPIREPEVRSVLSQFLD